MNVEVPLYDNNLRIKHVRVLEALTNEMYRVFIHLMIYRVFQLSVLFENCYSTLYNI